MTRRQFGTRKSVGLGLALTLFGCGSAGSGSPSETGGASDSVDPTGSAVSGGSMSGAGGGATSSGGTTSAGGATSSGGAGIDAGGVATGGAGGATGVGGKSAGGSGGVIQGDSGTVTPVAVGCSSSQKVDTWVNVTPTTLDVGTSCGQGSTVGVTTILVDPARPSDMYMNVDCRGTWRSRDCGATWAKVSTGTNGTKLDSGRPWFAAIDRNPGRDPKTDPAIYVTQGYGVLGLWKSTNAGVDWVNVWTNNIYAADGVTNISSDIGNDIASVQIIDPGQSNHLIVAMHGYFGNQGNTGIYESTDAGATWRLHKSTLFTFQPHNNLLWAYNASIWTVTPGTISESTHMFRTTNGGVNWSDIGEAPARGLARVTSTIGNTTYSSTDFNSHAYKTTDNGLTWTSLDNSGGHIGWVVATQARVYVSDSFYGPATIRHAEIASDTKWATDPPGMAAGSIGVGTTFDGTNHIVITGQGTAGVWRYVEP